MRGKADTGLGMGIGSVSEVRARVSVRIWFSARMPEACLDANSYAELTRTLARIPALDLILIILAIMLR